MNNFRLLINFYVKQFLLWCVCLWNYHNGIDTGINGVYTLWRLNLAWNHRYLKINFMERKLLIRKRSHSVKNKFCVIPQSFLLTAYRVCLLRIFCNFLHGKKLSNNPLIRLRRYLSRYLNMSHTRQRAHYVVALFSWEISTCSLIPFEGYDDDDKRPMF